MKTQLLIMMYLLAPIIRVMWDYRKIEIKRESIPYFFHNWVTLMVMTVQGVVMDVFLGVDFWKGFILSWGIYEILFDYTLNYFRNKKVFSYHGDFTDAKNLSWIEENIYARLPWWIIGIVKIGFFVITVILYQ